MCVALGCVGGGGPEHLQRGVELDVELASVSIFEACTRRTRALGDVHVGQQRLHGLQLRIHHRGDNSQGCAHKKEECMGLMIAHHGETATRSLDAPVLTHAVRLGLSACGEEGQIRRQG